MNRIIKDSDLIAKFFEDKDNFDDISEKEVIDVIPGVKNFKLIVELYQNKNNFTDEELLKDLRYLLSSKVLQILIIMKFRSPIYFRNNISRFLTDDFDKIIIVDNLFFTAVFYGIFDLVKYLILNLEVNPILDLNRNLNRALKISIKKNYNDIFNFILEEKLKSFDFNRESNLNILMWCCKNGYNDHLKLISKISKIDISKENLDFIKFLLITLLSDNKEIIKIFPENSVGKFFTKIKEITVQECINLINMNLMMDKDTTLLNEFLVIKIKISLKDKINKIHENTEIKIGNEGLINTNIVDIFFIFDTYLKLCSEKLPSDILKSIEIEFLDLLEEEKDIFYDDIDKLIEEFNLEKICAKITICLRLFFILNLI